MITEKNVTPVKRMYAVRNYLKQLCPDIFEETCGELAEYILQIAKDKGITESQSAIDLLKNLEGRETAQMWVIAALLTPPLGKDAEATSGGSNCVIRDIKNTAVVVPTVVRKSR